MNARERCARDFIDAKQNKDYARLGELVTDDVTWWLPPSVKRRGMETEFHGREDFLAALARSQSAFESIRMTADLVAAGDDAVGMIIRTNGVLEGGKPYVDHIYGLFFRFGPDDRVSDVWEMTDTLHAMEERGLL
jgi:ketosteroid isomerase-like protein